ncbi:MAG: class I SAM-dependent methyltransferase, partial [Ktedonobacterales bacterium]
DAALMMGPLYHLPAEEDRQQALSEMRRVLRLDGIAFTMMLTRAAAIYEGFNRWPEGILDTEGVQQLLRTGADFNFERDPHDFEGVYFAHPNEVQPLHERLGFCKLALVGCEAMLGGRREAFEQLPLKLQQAWIKLVLQVCEDLSLYGASERLLFVGKAC